MAKEERKVQPGFFEQFPQYTQLHRQAIAGLSAITPTNLPPLEGVLQLGETVLSFARSVGNVEPFKSDWQNHIAHFDIEVAKWTNRPAPFATWDELVDQYERDWKRWPFNGLTDVTILPIAQQVLSYAGLWTDESVRALVLNNLTDRCQVIFSGMEEMREHFEAVIPQGSMSTVADAQDFVFNVADNVSEMQIKRHIGHVRHWMTEGQMSNEDWEAFLQTEVGRKLGLFSTVEWWIKPSTNTPLSPRMETYLRIRREALAGYLDDPEYTKFTARPKGTINRAFQSFKQAS